MVSPSNRTVLDHVLKGMCSDPDCEVHQIVVGLQEETVGAHDLAMFIAGYQYAITQIADTMKDQMDGFHDLARQVTW